MPTGNVGQPDWHAIHVARARRLHEEEHVNFATHGAGLALSIAGVVVLLAVVTEQGDRAQVAACVLYGVSLVAVYLGSTLSHAFQHNPWRRLFRIVDQACIFLLIAGTFTPPAVTYLPPGPWWLVPGAMWCVAVAGFLSKAVFAHQVEAATTTVHVLMGWMPVLAIRPLLARAPVGLFAWLLAGGLFYTAGTLFLNRDETRRYFHAVWHVLVIIGSACHYLAILAYCTTAP